MSRIFSSSKITDKAAMNSGLFFVTAGRGTETFVAQELGEKFTCQDIKVRDGKVFFRLFWEENGNTPCGLQKLLQLKSVERVFAAITNYDNVVSGKRPFLDRLMEELSNKENFQHPNRVCTHLISSGLPVVERNWVNQGDAVDSNLPTILEDKTASEEQITMLSKDQSTTTILQNSPASIKKRKLDSACDDSDRAKEEKDRFSSCEMLSEMSSTCTTGDDPDQKQELSQGHKTLHGKEEELDDTNGQDNLSHTENNMNHEVNGSEKSSQHCPEEETRKVTFRMSVKCSGKISKWINTKKLSRDVARRVSRASAWSVDLRNPMYDVCVHINDNHVTAGVPLTRVPLSKRAYVHDSGLRAPIAWIMYRLASVKAGDTVLDPMCGKATILLEACSEQPDAVYVGSDQNTCQLSKAADNLRASGLANKVMLYQADALKMPFSNNAVDIVMCDAPFNQTHLTSVSPEIFYHSMLKETYRVLKSPGRFVLLTSQSLKTTVLEFMDNADTESLLTPCATSREEISETKQPCIATPTVPFIVDGVHYMKLGETHACIIVMNK